MQQRKYSKGQILKPHHSNIAFKKKVPLHVSIKYCFFITCKVGYSHFEKNVF